MSKAEARMVADRLLREANISTPHVRVKRLARAQGLAIEKAKLDRNVSSLLLRGKEPRIAVNRAHDRNRRRLAVAHALGHYMLHSGGAAVFVTDFMVHIRSGDPPSSDPRELEANAFALELLLPEHLLRKDLRDGVAIDLTDEKAVGQLAERYRVSAPVLVHRAARLGLIWGL